MQFMRETRVPRLRMENAARRGLVSPDASCNTFDCAMLAFVVCLGDDKLYYVSADRWVGVRFKPVQDAAVVKCSVACI